MLNTRRIALNVEIGRSAHIVDHGSSHIASAGCCGRLQVGQNLVVHHNIYLRVDIRLRTLKFRLPARPSQGRAAVGCHPLNAHRAADERSA